MKIAFLYKFFPSCGGVERVITILANELVRQSIGTCIYSYRQCLKQPVYPLDTAVQIIPLPNNNHIDNDVNVNFLVDEFKNGAFDVLFNHDTTSDSMNLCHQVKNRIPVKVITLHHGQIYLPRTSLQTIAGNYSPLNPRNLLFPLYCLYDYVKRSLHHRKNIHISDAYVLLSDTFRRQLGSSSKLRVIPNPLPFATFFPMDEYEHKENLVLMVGRLSETHKRFSLALQVWKQIEEDNRFNDWYFEIVGDGNDHLFIETLIKEKGLKRVRLIGQAQPEAYYCRAKLLMMTSAYEGFPLVLLEAAQYACVPVVMDSFETLHDIILDGINGQIVENNNLQAFANDVKSLMIAPEKMKKIAAISVEKSRYYDPSFLITKWIKLFNEILTI